MDPRERVNRALRFECPDRAPRDLWALAAVQLFRADELQAVLADYPPDIVLPVDPYSLSVSAHTETREQFQAGALRFAYGPGEHARGRPYRLGSYVDEWGCPWEVGEEGVKGEVKHPPLADWRQFEHFSPPWEVLEGANWGDVDRICEETSRFVLSPWHIDPFERMQFLRGTEALFIDLAYGTAEMLRLRDMLHEYFSREVDYWCQTDIDGIRFADDWGSQRDLLISPQMWRELFKPLYREYCQKIHAAGKFVFMHSDGNITKIIPDLIEIGVDALNSQLFCMDIEALAAAYRGKITFWGEIDRQQILPFGKVEDVYAAVRRVRTALDDGRGGVIAQLEWGKDVSQENFRAALEAWLE
jgi:hypothetical protein